MIRLIIAAQESSFLIVGDQDDFIFIETTGCQGYDNCWIYDGDKTREPGISLWSELSGIR